MIYDVEAQRWKVKKEENSYEDRRERERERERESSNQGGMEGGPVCWVSPHECNLQASFPLLLNGKEHEQEEE